MPRYAFAVLGAASLVTTHWVAYKTGTKTATPNDITSLVKS